MDIIVSTIITLIISIIAIGMHYIRTPKPIFGMVPHSDVVMKKRRNLKYKIVLSTLPASGAWTIPSTGVNPIEFISVTADPNAVRPSPLGTNETGINGANKFYLHNCNSDYPFVIQGFNMAVANANATDTSKPIVKSTYGMRNRPSSYIPYDGTKSITLNFDYQVAIESDRTASLIRATLICDNEMPLSLYAYFIDEAGTYRGIRFDNIKNDILVIDLYR
jgi:hypothetical protein